MRETSTPGRRVAKNMLLLLAQHAFLLVAGLIMASLIARHLGPDNFGVFEYAFTFAGIFSVISGLGLSAVTVRSVAQDRHNAGAILSTMLALRLLLAFAVLVPLWLTTSILHEDPALVLAIVIASLYLPIDSAADVIRDVFQGLERFDVEAVSGVLIRTATVIGSLVVIWMDGGVVELIVVYVAGYAVGLAIPAVAALRAGLSLKPEFSMNEAKRQIVQALPFGGIAITDMLMWDINPILLGSISGFGAVGLFMAGTKIFTPLEVIPDALSSSLAPTVARGWAEGSPDTEKLIERAVHFLLAIGLPIAVGGILCADLIIDFMFGDRYSDAVPVMQILMAGLPFDFIGLPAFFILGAIHQQHVTLKISIVGAVVNVVLALTLIPILGVQGCAIAVLAASVLCSVWAHFALAAHYKIWSSSSKVGRIIACVVAMAIIVTALKPFGLLAMIPGGVLTYTALGMWLKIEDWRQIKSLFRPPTTDMT